MLKNSFLKLVVQIVILVTQSVSLAKTEGSKSVDSSKNGAIQLNVDRFFNKTSEPEDSLMSRLLDTERDENLNFPPVPRKWVRFFKGKDVDTTTTGVFDTGKIAAALSTIQRLRNGNAFPAPVDFALGVLQLGGASSTSISYSYRRETSLWAMTSLRKVKPSANKNDIYPLPGPPTAADIPPYMNPLFLVKKKRVFFNSTEENPVLGMCKYDLSITITTTKDKKVSFVLGDRSENMSEYTGAEYTIYSNFFPIESTVPAQDYLTELCDDKFVEAVRFIAELDFNSMVDDFFAYKHPEAQCALPEEDVLNPKGDQSCMDWFYNPRYVMGSYRKGNVPRCVLGKKGIPICVLRSKEGQSCPIYEWNGRLTDRPEVAVTKAGKTSKSLTVGDYQKFSCDAGLTCKPPEGELNQYQVGWLDRLSGIDARCKKDK